MDVQAPDGTIARFPDGMADDAITAVMRQHYPRPPKDATEAAAHQTDAVAASAGGSVRTMTPEEEKSAMPGLVAGGYGKQPGIGEEASAVNDVVRSIANGMTLGGADRIAAGMGALTGIGGAQGDYAGNLANERDETKQFQKEHPVIDAGANMAGTAASTAAALPEAALSLPAAIGARAAAGGVIGGAQGFNQAPDWSNIGDTAVDTLGGAGLGAMTGIVAPAIAGRVGNIIAPGEPTAAIPTASTIDALKNAAYAKADALGAAYTPEAYGRLVDKIIGDSRAANISPARHPKAVSAIQDLQSARNTIADRGYPPSLTELDQLRQVVNRDVTSSPDAGERFFGKQITRNIDGFIANPGPNAMASGAAPEAAAAIQTARDLNTRAAKISALNESVDDARQRAGSTYSGGNVDNAIRQNLRRLSKTEKWTPDESELLKTAVMGRGKVQNSARLIGKLSPIGSGLMTALELGATAAGGAHAALVPAAGIAAKYAAEHMTRANVERLAQTILAGGKKPIVPMSLSRSIVPSAVGASGTGAISRETQPQGQ